MHLLLIFQLSRSSYYYLKNISEYDKYEAIKQEILEISRKHKNRYGYRRITQELHNKGFIINHKTVNKLMRALEIECEFGFASLCGAFFISKNIFPYMSFRAQRRILYYTNLNNINLLNTI